jgi:hypothetical protein
MDVPIRTGRFGSGKARSVLGIFKVQPEVIRTRLAKDIETIAHEIGHGLQKYIWPESVGKRGLKASFIPKQFKAEIEPMAYPGAKNKSVEGFAEFLRLYITNEKQAKERAPKFFNYFEKEMKAKSPESLEIFAEARDQFNKWVEQPLRQRIKSEMAIGPQPKELPSPAEVVNKVYTKVVDEGHPIKRMMNALEHKPKSAKDAYLLYQNYAGHIHKASEFLDHGTYMLGKYDKPIGKPFKKIIEPVK